MPLTEPPPRHTLAAPSFYRDGILASTLRSYERADYLTRHRGEAVLMDYRRLLYLLSKAPNKTLTVPGALAIVWNSHRLDEKDFASFAQIAPYLLSAQVIAGRACGADEAAFGEARDLYRYEFDRLPDKRIWPSWRRLCTRIFLSVSGILCLLLTLVLVGWQGNGVRVGSLEGGMVVAAWLYASISMTIASAMSSWTFGRYRFVNEIGRAHV